MIIAWPFPFRGRPSACEVKRAVQLSAQQQTAVRVNQSPPKPDLHVMAGLYQTTSIKTVSTKISRESDDSVTVLQMSKYGFLWQLFARWSRRGSFPPTGLGGVREGSFSDGGDSDWRHGLPEAVWDWLHLCHADGP